MRLSALLLSAALATVALPAFAQSREIVDASEAKDISVTIYRDPDRSVNSEMEQDDPRGFALISETRTVTLPAGQSTIRFIGVSEGMIGVSAIVTGLPGGTIEKNRNAELLSPAALVNGALGNRVTITRTNPATGVAASEEAIVRTRADGGLVLQSSAGFEAVRCAGLPEKLTFNRIPDGLYSKPVFTVDTQSEAGGTYEVTLTYLSWGFDWDANYVATLGEKARGDRFEMNWLSWLTLLNDNGQSFDNARLQIIAGKLNIESDFEEIADPPQAPPLRLTCYPIRSTARGSPLAPPPAPPPPPNALGAYAAMDDESVVIVTGSRRREVAQSLAKSVSVVTAEEENLGDLKLFRVPDRVNVSAQGMKQVAFLNKDEVEARFLYVGGCDPYDWIEDLDEPTPADILLATKNEEKRGLGVSLPQGRMRIFEPTSRGTQLSAATNLRDFARGQDIELDLGESNQVFMQCGSAAEDGFDDEIAKWQPMVSKITNANPHPVRVRVNLGWATDYLARVPRRKVRVKNGYRTVEVEVPANEELELKWKIRSSEAE